MKRRTDSILTFLKVFWIEALQFRNWITESAFTLNSPFRAGVLSTGLVLSTKFSSNI